MNEVERTYSDPEEIINRAIRAYLVLIIGSEGSWDVHFNAERTHLQIIRSWFSDQKDIKKMESILLGITRDVLAPAQAAGIRVNRSGGYLNTLDNTHTTTLDITIPLTRDSFTRFCEQPLNTFISQCTAAVTKYISTTANLSNNQQAAAQNLQAWIDQIESIISSDSSGNVDLEISMSEWIGPSDYTDYKTITNKLSIRPVIRTTN